MLWPAKKNRWVIPIAIGSIVLIMAFVALAVFFAVRRTSWIQTISGPTADGDTVVVAGLLTAMASAGGCAGLVFSAF
jgi:hypothetical protein